MKISKDAAKKALLKRIQDSDAPCKIVLEDILFDKQLDFIKDPSPFKIAVCSRRAGKSTGIAADMAKTASDLIAMALNMYEGTILYITGTRSDAKKIIWSEILKFNREHKLGGVPNISELTVTFPTRSVVRLAGAKDEQEIEKIRGQMPPIKKVYIDEAQSIRDRILVKLIDDILEAALMDFAAQLILTGTPGPIPKGYFYQMAHNLDKDGNPLKDKVWSVHGWTFFDNPYIPLKSKTTHQKLLERVLKRRGVTVDDPSIQREFFGKWVLDSESLLVKYDKELNHYDSIPIDKREKLNYIMGIDLGFDDADAIAILGWHDNLPATYLVHETVVPQQGITELVKQIEELQKTYPISKMVIDQGGLGKKIAEELRRRHAIPVHAADKTRKFENISLMNDALRTGRLKAKRESKFAQDSYLVEIDKDKSTPDKIKVSDRYHSDIIDAVLYAFRESPAYAYQEPIEAPKPWSKEWLEKQPDEMWEAAQKHFNEQNERE